MLNRLTLLLATVFLTAMSVPAYSRVQEKQAAARPDFSGTWSFVSWTTPSTDQFRTFMWDSPIKLTQAPESMILEYVSGGRNHAPVKLTYALDGSERKGVDPNGAAPYNLLLRADWQRNRLRLSTIYLRDKYGNIETTELLKLDSPATMTVEATWKLGDVTRTSASTWRR